MSETERDKHRDHGRKVGLAVAQAIADKWPTLHLDGYDVDEAARIVASWLPPCMTEYELCAEDYDRDHPPESRDPSKSIGNRLRAALGVEDVSTLQAIEIAIERLSERSTT